MNFAAELSDLTNHQQHVMPHPPRNLFPLEIRLFGKRKLQILLDHFPAKLEHIRCEKRHPLANGIASLDSHRLNQRQRHADGKVFKEVAQVAEHE